MVMVAVAWATVLSIKALRRPAMDEADGPASMETARRLARSGKRIQAIKMVREVSGGSLPEATQVVKSLESEPPPEL